LLAITGEIPRETSFEKGFPYPYTGDPKFSVLGLTT
jgi:hypothetical protein